jgi:tyrosyl-tRNA synthetase
MGMREALTPSVFDQIITDSDSFWSDLNGNRPLTIKWGADPSAPDLHLGHAVALNQLARLQELGHRVIFLIGDFTAQIGDPTGTSVTRPSLSAEAVAAHATTYMDQVFTVLNPQKTTVVYNSTWLNQLTPVDMIQLCAKMTVSRMLERDDFAKRRAANTPIGIHEFLYPLLQGYDSVHLKNDVEVGGTDQLFNLLVGRQLQKDAGIPPQSVLTLPLLEGLDGHHKMSKSLNNHIPLRDHPNDMFGKCMRIPDALIHRYYQLVTRVPADALAAIQADLDGGANPRDHKRHLAHTIVSQFHGADAADAARDRFVHVFSDKGIPQDIPTHTMTHAQPLVAFLVDQGLAPSKKEARRLMDQGAVWVNDHPISDPHHELDPHPNTIIRVGKRRFLKLI